MLAGRQENQTPRAEKQSPEKTKPGETPGRSQPPSSLRIPAKDLQNIPATQPTVTTPTPGRPAKKVQQKRTTAHPRHPTTPLPSMDPLQKRQELQMIPLPPNCLPPTQRLQKRTTNHPSRPPASPSKRTTKKNFKYCKP